MAHPVRSFPAEQCHDGTGVVGFDQRAHELGEHRRGVRVVDHERMGSPQHHVAGGSRRERLLDPLDVARPE